MVSTLMDSCSATLIASAHLGQIGNGHSENLGERLRGSMKSYTWGTKLGKSMRNGVRMGKVGEPVCILIDVNKETLVSDYHPRFHFLKEIYHDQL